MADPGEGPRDLRLLGFCIPQLPRFECTVKARVTIEAKGLTGGLKAELTGNADDYQRIEKELLKLADLGSNVSGVLTLDLIPVAPFSHGDEGWQHLQEVVTRNNPGTVTITATLAKDA